VNLPSICCAPKNGRQASVHFTAVESGQLNSEGRTGMAKRAKELQHDGGSKSIRTAGQTIGTVAACATATASVMEVRDRVPSGARGEQA